MSEDTFTNKYGSPKEIQDRVLVVCVLDMEDLRSLRAAGSCVGNIETTIWKTH